jgi:RNA polymerase sigma-70 factor (ECF subfamily)
MTLAGAFRAKARAGLFDALSDDALEAHLGPLLERGRARWPGVPLAAEMIAGEIAMRVPSLAALGAIAAEDVHLAVACAHGVRGAHAAFDAEYLGTSALAAALRRIDPSPAFVDEVRQMVRERLFVPPPGHIVEYSGKGSLAAWTRVSALRVALSLRPRRVEVEQKSEGAQAANVDPELRFLQQKYGRQFEEAVAVSFAQLDDQQHTLLRLQLVDGLGIPQIAALFRVDRTTISRRLAACREVLITHTHASLRESLGLSPESFASLARLLTSQLHLSVARLLKERG